MPVTFQEAAASLTTGGSTLTYYDTVHTHDRDGALMLVHGTGGTAQGHFMWLFPMLSSRQRVLAVDLSLPDAVAGGERELTLDDLADQVIAVLEHVHVDGPVTVLGYSLGSPVVLRAAHRRPDLVQRMVHLNGFVGSDPHRQLRGRLWRHLYERGDVEGVQQLGFFTAFSAGFLETQDAALLDSLREASTPTPFAAAQMDLNSRIEIADEAAELPQPSLVIGSREDLMVPLRAQQRLFGALAESRLAVIPGGHASVIERAAQVCRLVQDFLDDPTRHPAGTTIPLDVA